MVPIHPRITNNTIAKVVGLKVYPAIPLDRPIEDKLIKGQYETLKLWTDPEDSDSTTYELSVPYFHDGISEKSLLFMKNLWKCIYGQALMTGPQKFVLAHHLMQGDALASFSTAATTIGDETDDHFKACLDECNQHFFP